MKRQLDLRSRLREATHEAHERMHRHAGFSAAAAGRLDADAYRDLLARLYGFHRAFDADFPEAPAEMAAALRLPLRARSVDLRRDLSSLGVRGSLDALPICGELPERDTEAQWLGALYVTEGSTLGGAQISRALARSGIADDQRGFFEAYGERRSEMWRLYLERLERLADDSDAAAEAERAARAVFDTFERWMRDWEGASSSMRREPAASVDDRTSRCPSLA